MDISGAIRMPLSTLVFHLGLSKSKSEAKRLIAQGGIRIEGVKQEQDELVFPADLVGQVFQRGKRQFVTLGPLPAIEMEEQMKLTNRGSFFIGCFVGMAILALVLLTNPTGARFEGPRQGPPAVVEVQP